jgi:hypothetical protein
MQNGTVMMVARGREAKQAETERNEHHAMSQTSWKPRLGRFEGVSQVWWGRKELFLLLRGSGPNGPATRKAHASQFNNLVKQQKKGRSTNSLERHSPFENSARPQFPDWLGPRLGHLQSGVSLT